MTLDVLAESLWMILESPDFNYLIPKINQARSGFSQ